jgi:hypothetical protein
MSIIETLRYVARIAVRPSHTTEDLINDPHRLRHGITSWLIISFIYGLVAFIGGLNGLGAVVEPWLPISSGRYYLWMGPLTPLIYIVNFLILAGIIQLLSKLVNGRGSFEDTFTVVSLTFFFPVFLTMWVFETPVLVFFPGWRRTALGGLGYIPEWLDTGRQIVGVLWIFASLVTAVSRVQGIALWKSAIIIVLAAIPAWAIMLTYLR